MKFASLLLAGTMLLATTAAQASVVDFSGNDIDMGTVSVGQTGSITATPSSTAGSYSSYTLNDTASLPVNSEITLTYTFSNAMNPSLHSDGTYNYTSGGNHYVGESSAYADGTVTNTATTNGLSSAPLVFASANLTPTLGTATITSVAGGLVQITSMFGAIFGSAGRLVSVTYRVSSLSAVPLPAAFPLFAAVLAGLFGVSYLRKRRAAL